MTTLFLILLISAVVLSLANFLVVLGDLIKRYSDFISATATILLLSSMAVRLLLIKEVVL
jgi:hypothetical protein